MLSRGKGVRVALLTLNRGESGDNAIGSELFDAVGLLRTEELLAADRYYGVDRQYFTTVIDYGFSKRLEETLDKWGRENVLRDVVRDHPDAIGPFVLIARFQGNERDGHGNHEAAGLVTRGVQGRRRSGQVSRADCRRPSAVAAAEALYGRRSRDRGLDDSRRHGRVRPGAWRFVPGLQPRAASTSSGRRTAVSSCRSPALRSPTTSDSIRSSMRRRKKRASSTELTSRFPVYTGRFGRPPRGSRRRAPGDRSRSRVSGPRLQDDRSGRVCARARTSPCGHPFSATTTRRRS